MAKIKHQIFKQLLKNLSFIEQSSNIYKAKLGKDEYLISVDFNEEKIDYGKEIKVNSRELCNFFEMENLVVFECVCRLIRQGYDAKSIELEPRWKVGHGASGGKADILVKDKKDEPYLIIECKTYGSEFESHWKKTLNDGDQLFTYYRQDQRAKYVAMYTSQSSGEKIESKYCLISLIDNDKYLKSLGKKATGYKNVKNAVEAFKVWKDIYNQDYDERGIFENNLPYCIGKSRFTTSDLEDVTSSTMYETDKKFKNILRQHNIGSHENAFDKLVNLFLAKIVDEKENEDNLQFNWRGTSQDDIKSLMDRLQKLYKQGMKDFLNEEVTYVEKKDIDNAFRFYEDDKDAIKSTVLEYFDMLKYYTNNDFAFLDVHNEKLFKQNAQVLLKMVQMLQNFKLKTENHNQFLGDLFEGFLDNGVKQSEGQYFTPLPIVRYIVSSLPLKNAIDSKSEPLKMIDYACGAGHFLNEYANQVAQLLQSNEKAKDYYKNIYGIEKEYRLSKVSKVSAFMYSQDEINIIYDDALKHSRVKDNSFDILVANPPYSVKGFLETLDDNEKKLYELTNEIEKKSISTNGSIEAFFVERAKQLLVGDGIAAIILPASFLTNKSVYVKAREILISYFDIIAISEFSSGTFGKTGTPTVTLFLRRKKKNPETRDFVESRVNAWFNKDYSHDVEFNDKSILEEFCNLVEISYDEFLLNPNQFNEYKEKILYYYIVKLQKNPVIIIKSPVATKDLKRFLGYEWKNRNKSFKINYLGTTGENVDEDDDSIISSEEGIDKIKTPLFNPKDLFDDTKINNIIRDNYNEKDIVIPDNLRDFVEITNLEDLLKFKSKNFNLEISTTPSFKIKSKYSLIPLENNVKFLSYKQPQANELQDLIVDNARDVKLLPSSKDYNWWTTTDKCDNNYFEDEVIAIGQARYANIKYYNGKFISSNNMLLKSTDEKKYITKYLFHLFSVYSRYFYKRTGQYPAFNIDLFNEFEMPEVPYSIQQKIVDECDSVDNKLSDLQDIINKNESKILDIINKNNSREYKVNFDTDLEGGTGNRVLTDEVDITGDYPVISANVNDIFGWIDKKPKITDFSTEFVLWGLDGDWLTRYIPKNYAFYPTDHCGWIKPKENAPINMKYLKYVIELLGIKEQFSRTKRPTYDRIKGLDIRLPGKALQDSVVDSILPLENEIEKAKKDIESLIHEKEVIIDKYIL